MATKHKTIRQLVTLLAMALTFVMSLPLAKKANAGMLAFLERCETGTSVTGQLIYIGTYSVGGTRFQQTFTRYCPQTLEVQ